MVRACEVLLGGVLVASCGGGGGGGNPAPAPTPPTFAVGGTVSGLFGTGLVLENNGGNPLTVTANGTITFTTTVASGAAYNVTVRTQPTATPVQTCTVTSGAGTVGSAAVTSVAVQCRAQAGRFVYVAAAGAGAIPHGVAAFTIDANTGALTPMAGSPFATTGQAPRILFADRAGKFLYVLGDDNLNGPGGTTLTGFAVNAQTGALTAIPGLLVNLAAATGGGLALHPNGNFFYLTVSDGGLSANNQLHGFAINATTGALTLLPGSWGPIGPGEVVNHVALSPSGSSLYLASSTPFFPGPPAPVTATGTIRQIGVDAQTGALSSTASSQLTDGNNIFYNVIVHPAGTHVYARGQSPPANTTSRFTLDPTTGVIGTRVNIATQFGFGAIFTPGSRVYFPELGGTFASPAPGGIAGYVDGASGQPAALPGSPYATGGTNSLAHALDPTGRFIALTNIGSGNVTVMRIDSAQGSLAHVAGSPYAPAVGTVPGSVTFDPSARFAYLTDGTTSSISSYAINVDTGVPTFVSSVPTGGAPGVLPVTILGLQ